MNIKKKKRLRIALIVLLCSTVLLFLLVALVPFINPGKFWFISILGLAYPFLIVLVLIGLIVTALLRSRWFFLPLVSLLVSWQQISAVFAFRFSSSYEKQKNETTLRVLSWNVSRWTENKNSMGINQGNSYRQTMMNLVQEQNADVLCFQEFFECYAPTLFPENIEPIKKMGYPYYYFSPSSITVNGKFQTGLMIFSRYPIKDSAYFKTVSGGHSEGFSYADIDFNGQTIRIFNTHLESAGLSRQDYSDLGKTESSRSIFTKLKRSYYLRSIQAEMLDAQIKASTLPVILCGDVDDVPNSYAYFKVKGEMQDVFLKKGAGLGRTFRFISPTLRIDYIMADKKFKVLQYNKIDFPHSDHYPLLTDLEFR